MLDAVRLWIKFLGLLLAFQFDFHQFLLEPNGDVWLVFEHDKKDPLGGSGWGKNVNELENAAVDGDIANKFPPFGASGLRYAGGRL